MRGDLVQLGYIRRAHGLHGWVRASFFNPDTDALRQGLRLLLWRPAQRSPRLLYPDPENDAITPAVLREARRVGKEFMLNLAGVNDRVQAEELEGMRVYVRRTELPALDEHELYLFDLVGLSVRDEGGKDFGVLTGFDTNGAQELLVIERDGREYLLPDVPDFVTSVDLDAGVIVVAPPPGLLDDEGLSRPTGR